MEEPQPKGGNDWVTVEFPRLTRKKARAPQSPKEKHTIALVGGTGSNLVSLVTGKVPIKGTWGKGGTGLKP